MSTFHRPANSRKTGGGFGSTMLKPTQKKYPERFHVGGYGIIEGLTPLQQYPFTKPYVSNIEMGTITFTQGKYSNTVKLLEKADGREYAEITQSGIEKNKTFEVVPFNPDGV